MKHKSHGRHARGPVRVPPSREKVNCGYPGCAFNGEKRNYKRHNAVLHRGQAIIFENKGRGRSTRPKPVTKSHVGGWVLDWVETNVEEAGMGTDDPNTDTRPGSSEDFGTSPQPSVPRQLDRPAESEAVQSASEESDRRTAGGNVAVGHIKEKPRVEDPAVSYNAELLRSARSLAVIESASGHCIIADESKDVLYCSVCASEDQATKKTGRQLGIFKYKFMLGSTFSYQENLPSEFRGLKSAVGDHLKSSAHMTRAADDVKRREAEEAGERNTAKADMNVLRTAYHVLKESAPGGSFTKWIVTQKMNGADMGNINHSKGFMPAARLAFHDVIIRKLKEHVATQPCVSVMVDKVTVNRKTVDVIAVLTVVPEAPPSHLLQSFVVGAPAIQEHDGDALAKEIQWTLANIGVKSTEKLSVIAVDERYHQSNVPAKLLKKICAEDQHSQGPPSVAAIWDSADLTNLVDSDARKACPWVDKTTKDIYDVSKRFFTWKDFEELKDTGKKMGVKVRRTKRWSGAKFALHATTVLQAFLHNWEVMVAVLRERLLVEKRTGYASDLLADIMKLKDSDFRVRVAALRDIYDVILGRESREVQQVQILPWESRKDYGRMVTSIICMRTALKAFSASATTPVGSAEPRYDFAELWPTLSCHKLALRNGCEAKDIFVFCNALVTSLNSRMKANHSTDDQQKGTSNKDVMQAMPDIRAVADLQRFPSGKASPQGVVNASRRLVALNLIPASAEVSCRSAEATISVLEETPPGLSNQELFKVLWSRRAEVPELKEHIATCIRLWLVSPSESSVESMGSVLGEVFGAHRNLHHGNAAMELVVRWNGPETAQADSLVAAARALLGKRFTTQAKSNRHTNAFGTVLASRIARTCPRASVFQ